jgi:hypothetical protein
VSRAWQQATPEARAQMIQTLRTEPEKLGALVTTPKEGAWNQLTGATETEGARRSAMIAAASAERVQDTRRAIDVRVEHGVRQLGLPRDPARPWTSSSLKEHCRDLYRTARDGAKEMRTQLRGAARSPNPDRMLEQWRGMTPAEQQVALRQMPRLPEVMDMARRSTRLHGHGMGL